MLDQQTVSETRFLCWPNPLGSRGLPDDRSVNKHPLRTTTSPVLCWRQRACCTIEAQRPQGWLWGRHRPLSVLSEELAAGELFVLTGAGMRGLG